MSENKFCPNCGIDMSIKTPHKETCTLYLKQWNFIFGKGTPEQHTATYYGNTKKQALQDMLNFYKDAVSEADNLGIENSTLLDGCDEIIETGEVVKFG